MPIQFDEERHQLLPADAAREMYEPLHRLKFSVRRDLLRPGRAWPAETGQGKGLKKACMIYQDDDFGARGAAGRRGGLKTIDMELAEKTSYKRGATDFSSQVARMKRRAATSSCWARSSARPSAPSAKARKTGCNPVFFGTTAAYTDLIHKLGGKAMDGMHRDAYRADPVLGQKLRSRCSFWAAGTRPSSARTRRCFSVYGYLIVDCLRPAPATRPAPT